MNELLVKIEDVGRSLKNAHDGIFENKFVLGTAAAFSAQASYLVGTMVAGFQAPSPAAAFAIHAGLAFTAIPYSMHLLNISDCLTGMNRTIKPVRLAAASSLVGAAVGFFNYAVNNDQVQSESTASLTPPSEQVEVMEITENPALIEYHA